MESPDNLQNPPESEIRISIVLATCEGERFLEKQLQSFLHQSRQPDELVVCDDASTDKTRQIIRDFKENAPFSVLLLENQTRLGHVGAFNRALQSATGDIVFLSDQDDYWHHNKLSFITQLQTLHPTKLLFMNDAEISSPTLKGTGLTKMGQIKAAGYSPTTFVMGCCCAIRKELLDMCLPIPAGVKGHDNWLVGFALGLNSRVVSPEVLQLYRRHGENQSRILVNSTTPLNRFDRIFHQIKRAADADSEQFALHEIEQLQFFLHGIGEARGKAKPRWLPEFQKFENQLTNKVLSLTTRRELRKRPFFARFFGALRYWLQGGYSTEAGYKSMLRDIAG